MSSRWKNLILRSYSLCSFVLILVLVLIGWLKTRFGDGLCSRCKNLILPSYSSCNVALVLVVIGWCKKTSLATVCESLQEFNIAIVFILFLCSCSCSHANIIVPNENSYHFDCGSHDSHGSFLGSHASLARRFITLAQKFSRSSLARVHKVQYSMIYTARHSWLLHARNPAERGIKQTASSYFKR